MTVKQWEPEEGCNSCQRAKQLFLDNNRRASSLHTATLKQLKRKDDRIKELEDIIEGLKSD